MGGVDSQKLLPRRGIHSPLGRSKPPAHCEINTLAQKAISSFARVEACYGGGPWSRASSASNNDPWLTGETMDTYCNTVWDFCSRDRMVSWCSCGQGPSSRQSLFRGGPLSIAGAPVSWLWTLSAPPSKTPV